MGAGLLTGQETKSIQKIDAQSVQSAYKNGLLTNAKNVNTTDPKAVINRPHIVDTTSANIPNDLSWGIREVYYYGVGQFIIQITGIDINGKQNRWNCTGITEGDTLTIGAWTPEKYVHPTSAGNRHIPSGGSNGQILQWESNGVAIWRNGAEAVSDIAVSDNGNTVTVTYLDGCKEVMTVLDQNDYKVEEYDANNNLVQTTVTTTDINGNITVSRS